MKKISTVHQIYKHIIVYFLNMFWLQMQMPWILINLLVRLVCGLMIAFMVIMFKFYFVSFFNCLFHAFKSIIQEFMPIRTLYYRARRYRWKKQRMMKAAIYTIDQCTTSKCWVQGIYPWTKGVKKLWGDKLRFGA